MSSPVDIVPFCDHRDPTRAEVEIDAVFFEASTRTFAADSEREAFRERWLGRYLTDNARHAFVARDGNGAIIGYLVGCLDNPAETARFADLPYFRVFAEQCRRYPAHLHINIGAAWRGRGIGARLIETFVLHAIHHDAPGVHVVTAEGARNVGFYRSLGFVPVAETGWQGTTRLMLGRDLGK